MPKKFKGENSKAVVARERKADQKREEAARKEQEKEDEYWRDDDKHVMKKLQRKDEKEQKKQEELARKLENRALADAEFAAIGASSSSASQVGGDKKVTRAAIQSRLAMAQQEEEEERKRLEQKKIVVQEEDIQENINRLVIDGESARTVDEALKVLKGKDDPLDMHPEKRRKAAFTQFEANNMPRLKAENPNLRLSQLKQLLKKEWQKSPDNPMNEGL